MSRAGFWKRLRGFLLADASGALWGSRFGKFGALFGAIYSSAVAGPVFSALDNEYQEIQPIPIEPIEPIDFLVAPLADISTPEEPIEEEYGCIRSYVTVTSMGTGYLHNMILSKINENHPTILERMESTDLFAEYVVDEMVYGYGYNILDSTKDSLIQKVDSMSMVDVDWRYNDIVTYVNSLAPECENLSTESGPVPEDVALYYVAPQFGIQYEINDKWTYGQMVGAGYVHYGSNSLLEELERKCSRGFMGANLDLIVTRHLFKNIYWGAGASLMIGQTSKLTEKMGGQKRDIELGKFDKIKLDRADFYITIRGLF